jgi:hypothetical protein
MPSAAQAAWQISDEDSSIKFGFLAQMRAESVSPDIGSDTNDLFFRRLRLLAGGKLTDKISFFFETDSPNLGKGSPKGSSDVFIQDFVVTYKPGGDAFMLDTGMLLAANTYNSNQSAVSLMTTDYGPYSFVWSGPLDLRVGRDYGVRARGYLANDFIEYRLSVLQGNRSERDADFRFMGRVMLNFGDAQKGLYYSGTTLGKSKILSVGASFDSQEDYSQYSIDAHWDQPLGGGNAITASAAYSNIDGDDFLPSLAEQENIWLEAGFYFAEAKLLPFVQYAERDYKDNGIADSDSWQIGIGYMFRGHAGNVKLSYSQSSTDAVTGQVSNDVDTIWLNLQAFKF